MTFPRPACIRLWFVVALMVFVTGCDNAGGRPGWGAGGFPAEFPREQRVADDGGGAAPAGEQEDENPAPGDAPRARRPRIARGFDPLSSDSGGAEEDRSWPSESMPSQTERWGRDREMPGDSLPSRTERWGRDREMPGDDMPSRSFPSFSRDPLPSESSSDSSSSSDSADGDE